MRGKYSGKVGEGRAGGKGVRRGDGVGDGI